jgi:hypothetical protein
MTVEEYQVAQLWTVAMASKDITGGGEGVEVLKNEPMDHPKFGHCQYTYKIYHLASKVPSFIRLLAPKGSLEIYEEAWNAYPYCRTVITNPEYMKEGFSICIETWHKNDDGTTENVHELPADRLSKRSVVTIDIAADKIKPKDYKVETDPTKWHSEKTGRGPLVPATWRKEKPMMCAYKLVTCEFKWFGLQGTVENFIIKAERNLFTSFHRQVVCTMDKWHGLTMADIRAIEDETQRELDEKRHKGEKVAVDLE